MPDQPYTRARTITPGTPVPPGPGLVIACSVAGTVALKMVSGGGTLPVYVTPGTAEFAGYAAVDVDPAGTTATATVTVVY